MSVFLYPSPSLIPAAYPELVTMHPISLQRSIIAAILACASFDALSAVPSPHIVIEPMLGLRYEAARVKFDPLPRQAVANCEYMVDDVGWQSVWFIYARAQDASGKIYHVVGGYDISRNSTGAPKFFTSASGLIVVTDRGSCITVDQARDTFDMRLFDENITEPVLKLLATDYAKRLVRAFGGAATLRTELRNQYIDKDTLPPELLDALKPYLTK